MTRDSRKMRIWTRYFDSKLSRSNGRRVPKEASIWAARDAGISKMKREEDAKHPSRPFSKEGMLILSTKDALESTKAESKEGVLQSIGLRLRKNYSNSKLENKSTTINRPGNRQKLSQRKSFKNKAKSSKRKKKFGR
jgi:signal recognition particle subunit SEC65